MLSSSPYAQRENASSREGWSFKEPEPWNPKGSFKIPGYTGHVPRAKFMGGSSFSQTTRDAEPEFASTLQQLEIENKTNAMKETKRRARTAPSPSSTLNSGSRPSTTTTRPWQPEGEFRIPGYTGHIPVSKFLHGKSYAQNTRRAIDTFHNGGEQESTQPLETDHFKTRQAPFALELYKQTQREHFKKRDELHQTLTSPNPDISIPASFLETKHHIRAAQQSRPQSQENSERHFMPGYKGFVPGSRNLHGRSYAETTRQALRGEHTQTLNYQPEASITFPQALPKSYLQAVEASKRTKPTEAEVGHVPGYTGFIPSRRFQFGSTYGKVTLPSSP